MHRYTEKSIILANIEFSETIYMIITSSRTFLYIAKNIKDLYEILNDKNFINTYKVKSYEIKEVSYDQLNDSIFERFCELDKYIIIEKVNNKIRYV